MIDTTKSQDILTAVIILMRSHLAALREADVQRWNARAERVLEGAIQDLEREKRQLKEQNIHAR